MTSGQRRAEFGCIVSFENDAGGRLTLTAVGPVLAVMRTLCARAVSIDPTYKVRAYSTPETVTTDLSGVREHTRNPAGAVASAVTPENTILRRIGLAAMLHPSLLPATAERKLESRRIADRRKRAA